MVDTAFVMLLSPPLRVISERGPCAAISVGLPDQTHAYPGNWATTIQSRKDRGFGTNEVLSRYVEAADSQMPSYAPF